MTPHAAAPALALSAAALMFGALSTACPQNAERRCNTDGECLGVERCVEGTCVLAPEGEGEGTAAEGEGDAGEGEGGAEGEGGVGEGEGGVGEGEGDFGEGEGDFGEGEGEGEGSAEGEGSGEGEGVAGEGEGEGARLLCPGTDAAAGITAPDGDCFERFDTPRAWVDAETDCRTRGGHLASSHDSDTETLIGELAVGGVVWIGGTDAPFENAFQWTDGSPSDFAHFGPGEPNGNTAENCLEFSGGDWNDQSCGVAEPYVCLLRSPSRTVCGNFTTEHGEACDDGNTVDGDGCRADCSAVEPGFTCSGIVCAPDAQIVNLPPGGDVAAAITTAGGGGALILSAGSYPFAGPLAIPAGRFAIVGVPGTSLDVQGGIGVDVPAGAHLALIGVALASAGTGSELLHVEAGGSTLVAVSSIGPTSDDCIDSAGSLILSQVTVHDCGRHALLTHAGSTAFAFNTLIHDVAGSGGIDGVVIAVSAASFFEHLTIVDYTGTGAAISCSGGAPFLLAQSIVARSNGELIAGCKATETLIDDAQAPVGFRNLGGDPRFVDPGNDDFHLGAASPAINASILSATATDLDDAPRDSFPDLGAYEHVP